MVGVVLNYHTVVERPCREGGSWLRHLYSVFGAVLKIFWCEKRHGVIVVVVVVSRSGERKRNKRKIVYRERELDGGLTKFVLEMREKQRKEGRRGPI